MNNEQDLNRRKIKDYIIKLIDLKNLEEAKGLINDYKLNVTDDAEIYSLLSVIYVMENNIKEAESTLREALKVDSTNIDILYNLAYLYECPEIKCLPLALHYYRRCLELTDDKDLISGLPIKIDELKSAIKTVNDDNRPLVSIVVLAYNQLEYTKLCIDSIYKYTSHINYELVTVDNGSSDDTKAYFEGLPHRKIVNIVNNVRAVDGFNAGMEAAEGKYTAVVSNDFIFTHNWLDNLLICIESDESIGYVSPGANSVSNLQQISCNYSTIDEMQEFAKAYNVSDPSKWEERVRLMPCVLLCKTELLQGICGYDSRFYYGEFADDDISFRIRRAGYKIVYCGDTFTHHAGSVTTGIDQRVNSSLSVMKVVFVDKHNIDPHVEATFDLNIVNTVNYERKDHVSILGINTFCGGTPLQIKNTFRSLGLRSVDIVNITENEKYLEDLKTVSNEAYYLGMDKLEVFTTNKQFDIIIYENGFDHVDNIDEIISTLKNSLHPGGQLILTTKNVAFYQNLFTTNNYEQNLYGDGNKASYLSWEKTSKTLLNNKFKNIKIIRLLVNYDEDMVNALIKAVPENKQEEFKIHITTSKYLISCEA